MADLDYVKLWRTLMRTGINQRFTQIRTEFFMRIASAGPSTFEGEEQRDEIIAGSPELTRVIDFTELVKRAVSGEDKFKHYRYETTTGDPFVIEYFANVSRGIPKEFVDYSLANTSSNLRDYDVDGYCLSVLLADDNEDAENETSDTKSTVHLIVIGEGDDSITPDNYPEVIKHELTHACLFELMKVIERGYYETCKVPASWTDDEILQWRADLLELSDVLENHDTFEKEAFGEFVSDFLMYESDGQTKEKNPVVESRVPRTTKSDAKPKVTYRTLTPLDRFDERLGIVSERYHDAFQEIVDTLRPLYDKYDEFLDSVKM